MIESITPEHIQYKTICAIFSWLSVIKCASLIGRLYEKKIGLNEYNRFALIHCCCCRDLCTAVLLQRSWCQGSWRQTGLRTSRSPFCDREMACTVGKESKTGIKNLFSNHLLWHFDFIRLSDIKVAVHSNFLIHLYLFALEEALLVTVGNVQWESKDLRSVLHGLDEII